MSEGGLETVGWKERMPENPHGMSQWDRTGHVMETH